jgi:hypothetical protein
MTTLSTLQREHTLPLHDDAVALMFSALDGVKRYANNPVVTADLTITVRTHVERLMNDPHHILRDGLKAWPQFADLITTGLTRRYQVHDFDEVICEQMTAMEETHPQWKEALRAVDPIGFQYDVAQFFYRLALYSCHTGQADLFHQRIAQARSATGIQTNGFGLSDKSPLNLIQFYTTARGLIIPDAAWSDWAHPAIIAGMTAMQHYYDSIETSSDFLGCLGKTLEKLDGSHYCLEVHARKLNMDNYDGILLSDYQPDVIPRTSTRYEGMLNRLHQEAKKADDPELKDLYQNLAIRTTRAVYDMLRAIYQVGPTHSIYRNRIFERQELLAFYDDLLANNNLPLPPEGGIALDLLFDVPQAA